MGYRHITNLYRPEAQHILLMREVYATEKIHGTSAHIKWHDGRLTFFSGGEKYDRFVALFNESELTERFMLLGHSTVTIYGEAYGGKQQGQSYRYGPDLKFIAFEALIGETWLNVPNAEAVAHKLGLEFVHYAKVTTDIASLDSERDAPSVQAMRNGMGNNKPREGVVLRPLVEVRLPNGERMMAKHKRAEERETKTERKVDAGKLAVIEQAGAIADEWVTETRLEHVLDKLPEATGPEHIPLVIAAMVEDVTREGAGEFVDGKEARSVISKKTAQLFKRRLQRSFYEKQGAEL